MKRCIFACFAVILAASLVLPAFAASDSGETAGEEVGASDVVSEPSYDDSNLVGISVYALSPVVSDNVSGLKAVLLNFLGSYDAVVVEYEYQDQDSGYSSFLREVQPDYVWLCSCGLLIVMIYCLFRLGGAILCRK